MDNQQPGPSVITIEMIQSRYATLRRMEEEAKQASYQRRVEAVRRRIQIKRLLRELRNL